MGGIWKDEIEDIKESLERKEYLLQLAEQRVTAFEKPWSARLRSTKKVERTEHRVEGPKNIERRGGER